MAVRGRPPTPDEYDPRRAGISYDIPRLVIDECVDEVLIAQVLEEILLAPQRKHSVSELDGGQIPARRQHRRLVVLLPARDLAEPQVADADLLVGEVVADVVAVELCALYGEAARRQIAPLPLAVGQDVEAIVDDLGPELGAAAAAIEDHDHRPFTDELADLLEQWRQHGGGCGHWRER